VLSKESEGKRATNSKFQIRYSSKDGTTLKAKLNFCYKYSGVKNQI